MNDDVITCRQAIEFLADYLDGSLADEAVSQFEHHLEGCRSCVAYLASYRDTIVLARSTATKGTDVDELPGELLDAILRTVRRELDGEE